MIQFFKDLPTYFDFFKWFISRKKWIGRHYYYWGRARRVDVETYDAVKLNGLPSKISKTQLKQCKYYILNEQEYPYK